MYSKKSDRYDSHSLQGYSYSFKGKEVDPILNHISQLNRFLQGVVKIIPEISTNAEISAINYSSDFTARHVDHILSAITDGCMRIDLRLQRDRNKLVMFKCDKIFAKGNSETISSKTTQEKLLSVMFDITNDIARSARRQQDEMNKNFTQFGYII